MSVDIDKSKAKQWRHQKLEITHDWACIPALLNIQWEALGKLFTLPNFYLVHL